MFHKNLSDNVSDRRFDSILLSWLICKVHIAMHCIALREVRNFLSLVFASKRLSEFFVSMLFLRPRDTSFSVKRSKHHSHKVKEHTVRFKRLRVLRVFATLHNFAERFEARFKIEDSPS